MIQNIDFYHVLMSKPPVCVLQVPCLAGFSLCILRGYSSSLLVLCTLQGGVTSMPPVVPFAFTIKILDDQEITDNCRRAQIYNDIHIITRKYADIYGENGRFDRRKLALIP